MLGAAAECLRRLRCERARLLAMRNDEMKLKEENELKLEALKALLLATVDAQC